MNNNLKNKSEKKNKFISQYKILLSLFCIIFNFFLFQQKSLADDYSSIAPLATKSLLLDGFSINEKLVVVGERGHILISNDGHTWQQSKVPTLSTLTSVYFTDVNNGWVVGHDAVILRTTDGGMNWSRTFYAPEQDTPLLDVWFRDVDYGIAIGAYGIYMLTNDGGRTWVQKELNVVNKSESDKNPTTETKLDDDNFIDSYDLHLNSLALSDDGQLYIVAEAGRIYRSDDFGNSWIELPSPYIGSLFGLLILDQEKLLVFGLRGHLFFSNDSGSSWRKIETNTKEMLTNAIKLEDGTIFICGLGSTILMSNDNGHSFSLVDFGTRNGFSTLLLNQLNEIITVGEKGVAITGNINTLK